MENNTAPPPEITINGNGTVPTVSVTDASPEKKISGATTVSLPSTKSVVTNEPKRRVSIASDPVAVAYDNLAFEPNPKGRKISQVCFFFCSILFFFDFACELNVD